MEQDKLSAESSCLCGAVSIRATAVNRKFYACHCDMCRKWSGSMALSVNCGSDVSISGSENVTVFNSSEWAERGFCCRCGTHLFYRVKNTNQYIIPVGFFDDLKDIEFESQLFIDSKPAGYSFANETHNLTRAQVFAMYAPKE